MQLFLLCNKAYDLLLVVDENDKNFSFRDSNNTGEHFALSSNPRIPFTGHCTTNRGRYGDVVAGCLLLMAEVPGFEVTGNGSEDDFRQAQRLVASKLCYPLPIQLSHNLLYDIACFGVSQGDYGRHDHRSRTPLNLDFIPLQDDEPSGQELLHL
jgi:hypothetical protein